MKAGNNTYCGVDPWVNKLEHKSKVRSLPHPSAESHAAPSEWLMHKIISSGYLVEETRAPINEGLNIDDSNHTKRNKRERGPEIPNVCLSAEAASNERGWQPTPAARSGGFKSALSNTKAFAFALPQQY